MKKLGIIITVFGLINFVPHPVMAEDQPWAQCPSGAEIVHCETINCPRGDTNGDGTCTLKDTGARVVESRNDAFCQNPPSGCGQVFYYPANTANACFIRVKESGSNCDLYQAGQLMPSPTSTPKPTASPSPKPNVKSRFSTPAPTSKPQPTSTPALPATGPSVVDTLTLISSGIFGLFLFHRFRSS